jgi:hypothetical protein
MAPAQINDRKTAMSESDSAVNEDTGVIRPAMRERIAHADQLRFSDSALQSGWSGYAANSAHLLPTCPK